MEIKKTKKKKKSIAESAKWLQFRDKWIAQQPSPLTCFYCGRADLVTDAPLKPGGAKSHVFNRVKGLKPELIATVDHIHAQAKGGGKFDESNFAVCCHQCNQLKRDLHLEDWLKQMQTIIDNMNKKKSLWERLFNRPQVSTTKNNLIYIKNQFTLTLQEFDGNKIKDERDWSQVRQGKVIK